MPPALLGYLERIDDKERRYGESSYTRPYNYYLHSAQAGMKFVKVKKSS